MRPLASLLCLAFVLSCGASPQDSSPIQPIEPEAATGTVERDRSPQAPSPDVALLVAGNTDFGLALQRAAFSAGEDAVSSPHSISEALAMTWAGAQGETATQMAAAMRFTLPPERFHPAFDALDLALGSRGGLKIVNSLWGQQAYPWRQPFLDLLAQYYGAGLSLVDYRTDWESARGTINGWVAQETKDRIQDLLPAGCLDRTTRLVLVDAVTFDGAWQAPFDPGATQDRYFRADNGMTEVVKVMRREGMVRGAATDELVAAELPYEGGALSMVVIAPRQGTLADFEASLSVARLDAVLDALTVEDSTLRLPRFRIASPTVDLSETLEGMGMSLAFDRAQADFGPMAERVDGENLHIDKVLHKAFIAVGEEGTEAAAATAVIMGGDAGCVGPIAQPDRRELDFTRPFFFAIRDVQTREIIFLGHVAMPHE